MTLSLLMNGNIIDSLYFRFLFFSYNLLSTFTFSITSVSPEQLQLDERLFLKYLIELFKCNTQISQRNEAIHHSKTDVPFILCGPRRCASFLLLGYLIFH